MLRLAAGARELTVFAELDTGFARCPRSGSRSERVHSRYSRTVSDLPLQRSVVTLELRVRRSLRPRRHQLDQQALVLDTRRTSAGK